MCSNVTYIARHITVLGTGDKQTGFYRNGINFKASIDALIILRGFFIFKGGVAELADAPETSGGNGRNMKQGEI